MSTYSMYEFPERDDLEMGMDMVDDRDMIEYHDALDAAEKAGEPWFSFEEFLRRCEANRRLDASKATTLPAPSTDGDDEIPF